MGSIEEYAAVAVLLASDDASYIVGQTLNVNGGVLTNRWRPVLPTSYPFAAILFDMDGTLIDNVPLHQAVWREFTQQHGLTLTDEQLDFAKGRKAEEVVGHFWPAASPAKVAALTAARQELYRSWLADSDLVWPVAGADRFL